MSRCFCLLLISAALLCGRDVPAQDAPAAAPAEKPVPKSELPRIRTGVVAKAEFTSDRPDSDPKSPIAKKSSPAWAVLTLSLDPGRAASIFDYVLRKDGTEYPCIDLADGGDRFEGKLRNYSSVDGKKCRMAFPVPSQDGEYELVFKLIPGDDNPVKLQAK